MTDFTRSSSFNLSILGDFGINQGALLLISNLTQIEDALEYVWQCKFKKFEATFDSYQTGLKAVLMFIRSFLSVKNNPSVTAKNLYVQLDLTN